MKNHSNTRESAPASDTRLIRRLLALAWQYRSGCLKLLAIQILLIALNLSGLSLMGTGVDYIRCQLPSVSASAPAAAPQPADLAPPAPPPKPPRWPLGLAPPARWPPMTVLAMIAGGILAVALLRALLNMANAIYSANLVQGQIVVDLRARVYEAMQRMSLHFFSANTTGSLMNRVSGDVQAVRMFVDGVVIQTLTLVLTLVIFLVYMTRIHTGLTLACLATTPLLWWITSRFSTTVQPAYHRERELSDHQVLMLSENLQGIHVVKGFAREQEQIDQFQKANQAVYDQKNWIFRKVSMFHPLITYITQLNLVVMLGYGGYLVVAYEKAPDALAAAAVGLSVGQLLIFSGLLSQFSNQIANIANIANSAQQCIIAARRVFEVMDAPVEITSPPDATPLPAARGELEFDRVTFAFGQEEPVLDTVSFRVKPGERLAILGATGSGKTTLLNLVPRFFDPSSGRVLVDGLDVRTLNLHDLRRNIGMVSQESFLFSNTVAANIAFGRPEATREQIERAARIASAHDFIMALPDGYDTILYEGGLSLSGGQRQRLAIARAILSEPAILLLDDPTSAVDPGTEENIMDAIEGAMAGRTTIIVAHRLSTLQRADRIIVLNEGRIIQSGTHRELLKASGQYRWTADLQMPDLETCVIVASGWEE